MKAYQIADVIGYADGVDEKGKILWTDPSLSQDPSVWHQLKDAGDEVLRALPCLNPATIDTGYYLFAPADPQSTFLIGLENTL
jgi:hypothetical protein